MSEPVSRILYGIAAVTVIPLGRPLLNGSSDLPGSCGVLRAFKPAAEILSDSEESKDLSPWRFEPRRVENGLRRLQLLPYLVLLRVGFALPHTLLRERCALTAPFHPYPNSRTSQAVAGLRLLCLCVRLKADRLSPFTYLRRYIFCGTFRKVALTPPSRTLSGTLLCGVRTFLSL